MAPERRSFVSEIIARPAKDDVACALYVGTYNIYIFANDISPPPTNNNNNNIE